MRAVLLVAGFLWSGLWAVDALAQPSGAHPRIWLTEATRQRWAELADQNGSAVARAVSKCERVQSEPGAWVSGQYQGFAWVEALSACLVAWQSTDDDGYRDTALIYLRGLLDDHQDLGDGAGPAYADGAGIVAQDSGYSMRTHGVWAALGYDWLHSALTATERERAHQRFTQWLAFHQEPDSYQRAQPGANYHAGHLLAVTLIAIGHADEMNTLDAGSGTELWSYVVDEMWGDVMAEGVAARGPLVGGDWLEGWQYAPLSVASYALGARALVEQGVAVPWLATWSHDVLHRYVHGLSPDDRMFVGGDTGDETPLLDVNALPLWAVIASASSPATAANARAELERLDAQGATDFQLFYEALAEASAAESTPLDRSMEPTAWLATGAGNFYGRTVFSADASWLVSQCKGTIVDHQHPNAGNLVLSRGADGLLIDPGPYGSLSTLTGNAPTISQPHFNDNYQPSQGAWGETATEVDATRFVYTRATLSNVLATRCDWDGQLRFQDNASQTVSDATRDVVLLPGVDGASVVVIDRVLTTPSWSATADPLLLRFRSLGDFEATGDRGRAMVGDSRLLVRRVIGDATNTVRPLPVGDCYDGDRGKCEAARFAGSELGVEVPGPQPFTAHVLDADAEDAVEPSVLVSSDAATELIVVERESRRFTVVVTRDATQVASYDGTSGTHVVLDPPAGDRVSVTATSGTNADTCRIDLAAASGTDGFASHPLVFTLDASCSVAEETSQPPVIPPEGGAGGVGGNGGNGGGSGNGGNGGNGGIGGEAASGAFGGSAGSGGMSGGSDAPKSDSGCGCSTINARTTPRSWLLGLALAVAYALHRATRRRRA